MTENTSAGNFPRNRNRNLTTQEIGDEILIYDLEINRAFCLNRTAALVWQHSNGQNSVAAIALKLGETLNQPVSEQLIWLALDQLSKENLLLTESVPSLPTKGASRRKLLREAALTSAIALPLISALTAPTPVQAQSSTCIPIGSYGCRTVEDCCPPPPNSYGGFCDTTNGGRCGFFAVTT